MVSVSRQSSFHPLLNLFLAFFISLSICLPSFSADQDTTASQSTLTKSEVQQLIDETSLLIQQRRFKELAPYIASNAIIELTLNGYTTRLSPQQYLHQLITTNRQLDQFHYQSHIRDIQIKGHTAWVSSVVTERLQYKHGPVVSATTHETTAVVKRGNQLKITRIKGVMEQIAME